MDRQTWRRLEELCSAALDRPASERAAFLRDACADDAGLLRDANSLLNELERDSAFLERPLALVADLVMGQDGSDGAPPVRFGPYRVVRSLGRGGMGEVYLASHETGDVRQLVALKAIRAGTNAAELLERFRLERRILASLSHPSIARFLGAGAGEDGRPYFAMEYVEGEPIDAYCDANRLPIDERLRLFLLICDAVQHAHQNLVVHRDLKPNNILVDGAGFPKLLDFGIGKVLGESDTFGPVLETRTTMRPLSLAHAAPEQIRNEPITTATDVYALGILLYQLLAGRHPYVTGDATAREIERSALEAIPLPPSASLASTPPPPSRRERGAGDARAPDRAEALAAAEIARRRSAEPGSLRRRLAGDLDTIVLKAVRKEPERRYPSPSAMADDIRRHLAGLPVGARPDTLGYRARKFVRRNAGWVAAAAVACLALGATTAVTVVQSRRVARESARVTRERDIALEVRSFLMEMFGASAPDRAAGDSVTARQLLDLQAAGLADAYPDRPDLRAEMLEVLADGYDRLGLYAAAEPLARQALALRREQVGATHPEVGPALNLLGWILHERGESSAAEPLLREAVAIRRAAGPGYRVDLSRSLNDLGVVLAALARSEEAEAVLVEALSIRSAELGTSHRSVGITASNLAVVYYQLERLDDAIRTQERAVIALSAAVGGDHQRSVVALGNLAAFRVAKGDWRGAIDDYRDLLTRQTRLQGRDHPTTAFIMESLASALGYEAGTTGNDAAFEEANALLEEALAVKEVRLGPSHPEVGTTLDHLGALLLARGRLAPALAVQQRAVAILRSAYGDAHPATVAAVGRLDRMRAPPRQR